MFRRQIFVGMLAVAMLANFSSAQSTTAPTTAPTKAGIDPKADEVLHKTVDFYKSAKSISCDLVTETKVTRPGMTQIFSSNYAIAIQQPNQFSIVMNEGVNGGTIISDGKQMTFYVPAAEKYATEKAPASFTAAMQNAEMALNSASFGGMVVAALFSDDAYTRLTEGVETAKYIGEEDLNGTKAHHLRFSEAQADMDVWISAGESPLLLKIVPDLTKSIQQSRQGKNLKASGFADFNNWKVNQEIAADKFTFTPPADASKARSIKAIFGMEDEAPNPILGQAAPAFELGTLDGGKVSLADFKDKNIVIIDFWATWCGPCVKSLPIISQVADAYKDKGVVFYAVNEREDSKTIEAFLQKQGLKMPVALDAKGDVGQAYGVTGIPQTVIIGKDGSVQAIHIGFAPGIKEELSQQLDTLLKGESLSKPAGGPVGPPTPEGGM